MTLKLHERSNVHDQEDQETEGAEIFPVDLIKQLLTGSEQGCESILGESGMGALNNQLAERDNSGSRSPTT